MQISISTETFLISSFAHIHKYHKFLGEYDGVLFLVDLSNLKKLRSVMQYFRFGLSHARYLIQILFTKCDILKENFDKIDWASTRSEILLLRQFKGTFCSHSECLERQLGNSFEDLLEYLKNLSFEVNDMDNRDRIVRVHYTSLVELERVTRVFEQITNEYNPGTVNLNVL